MMLIESSIFINKIEKNKEMDHGILQKQKTEKELYKKDFLFKLYLKFYISKYIMH